MRWKYCSHSVASEWVVWCDDEADFGLGNWLHKLDLEGKEAVEFHFATGGFWAIREEVVGQLDWPDPRLIHANDDFLLGEALRQNGFEIADFRDGLSVNDAPRRNADAAEAREMRS